MKVKLSTTIVVDTDDRAAIAWQLGRDDDSLATHQEVKEFYENNTLSIEDARKQYFKAKAEQYAKLAGENASK